MCNNNCGFGGGCCLWILILIILIFACGGCGGRPDSAMAGCKNVDKLPDAMAQAAALVRDMIQ